MSSDERTERIARNEVLFREVNERIAESSERFSVPGSADFMCECGLVGCSQMVHLSLETYETLRSDSTRFAVVAGHEIEDVERVVERHEHYVVVEKIGRAREIAEETDPRS